MISHAELVTRAERWLKGAGKCNFAFTELSSFVEIPDAIGFSFQTSILIECKTSRSDFKADLKKEFRKIPERGCGLKRYFLCEKDLISTDELPEGWGLIYVIGKRCRMVKRSVFNWSLEHKSKIRFNERHILISALNRFGLRLNGDFSQIYDLDWKPTPLYLLKIELKGWHGVRYWGPI